MKNKIISIASYIMMLLLLVLANSCVPNGSFFDEPYGRYSELTTTNDQGEKHWVETFRVAQDLDDPDMPYVRRNYSDTGFVFVFTKIYRKYSDKAYGDTNGHYTIDLGHYEVNIWKYNQKKLSLETMLSKGTVADDLHEFHTDYCGVSYSGSSCKDYVEGTIYVKELTEKIITLEFKNVKYVDYDRNPYFYSTLNGTMSFEREDEKR